MSVRIPASTLERYTTFGDYLRFLRRRAGITQMELSIAVGYSDAQISRLEQNMRLPDLTTVEARFVPALDLEDDPQAVARLLELAATAEREDAPTVGLCPYKGLSHFEEADAALFVGREDLTAELVKRVHFLSTSGEPGTGRFLAIIGASGSGKSSLVRAGLVPALRNHPTSASWPIYTLTPTAHPVEQLAVQLTAERGSVAATARLMDDLARDPRGLDLSAKQLTRATHTSHLVLVIDQFEELFTLCRSDEERSAFIDNLLTAANDVDGPVTMVITLRADFYAYCAAYPQLREALARGQEYIGAMGTPELHRAIEEPARRGRWDIEPGLVDLILHDVGAEPGALPLLSHALWATWQRRRGRMMTLSGYLSSGGVNGAIAETAEAVFTDRFSPAQQAIARRVFLRLTELGDETATGGTRRRAPLSELVLRPEDADATQAVLNALADARLVTISEDAAEVAHEALIREWPRLHDWLEDNREGLHHHRHLTEAVQDWLAGGRAEDLLYRGTRLDQAREWAAIYAEDMNAQEREFFEASIALHVKEVAEQEAQHLRELEAAQRLAESERQRAEAERQRAEEHAGATRQLHQRAVFLTGALGIALVMALVAGFFGAQARKAALSMQGERRIALARELAAAAVSNFDIDPERSLLLALEAISTTHTVDGSWTSEAEDALRRALQASRVELALRGHSERVWAVAYGSRCAAPSGEPSCRTLVYSASDDATVKAWDAESGQQLFRVFTSASRGRHGIDVFGSVLATTGDIGTARLWNALTGEEMLTLRGHTDWVSAVAFSPDGTQLATASEDRSAMVWDTETGQRLLVLRGHTDSIWDVAFSPDNRYLATAGEDGRVIIWDAASGQELVTLSGHMQPVNSIAFSPACVTELDAAGKPCEVLLASAGNDRTVRIWNARTGQEQLTLRGHTDTIWQVAFSPDGTRLASAGSGGQVIVWDAASGQELLTLRGHAGPVVGIAFSPDCAGGPGTAPEQCGTHLASASWDGTVRVWDVSFSRELLTFLIAGLSAQASSPDGTLLAAGLTDGTISLRQIPTNLSVEADTIVEQQSFHGHSGRVSKVAFSPDGSRLASAGEDGMARLWDPATGAELVTLRGHTGSILDMAFDPSGARLATTGIDQTVRVWDTVSGETLLTLSVPTWSYAVAFSPDGSRLVAGTNTGVIIIWDVTTGKETLTLREHTGAIWDIAVEPEGMRLASASNDGTARIWDASSGGELLVLRGHGGAVNGIAFAPGGLQVATAGQDGMVKIWDTTSGQELLTILGQDDAVGDVAFSADGSRLFTVAVDGVIRLYLPRMTDLVDLAHTRITRSFTEDECRKYLHLRQELCAAAGAEAILPSSAGESLALSTLGQYTRGKVCEVTDEAGLNDEFYNQMAYIGMQVAKSRFGWEGAVLESQQAGDYGTHIAEFVRAGCDLIVIPKGPYFGDIVAAAAEASPSQKFLVIEWEPSRPKDKVWTQVFAVDQAGFLAGYVAAAVTKTGKVATFGGAPIPSVTVFMDGFALGVEHYNRVHGTEIQVLGWSPQTREGTFAGGFVATDDGQRIAEELIASGADVILPVAGPLGLGAAAAASRYENVYVIGVDSDWAVTYPEYSGIVLTSIEKRLDVSVVSAVEAIAAGSFQGGQHVGTLGNGGVSLSPFHALDRLVSEEVKADLGQITTQIVAGTLRSLP